MKNAVAFYLLTAMAEEAIFVAIDNRSDYESFALFGRIAGKLEPFIDAAANKPEDEYDAGMLGKLKRFLRRELFGDDQWYRTALSAQLAGKAVQFEEHELQSKQSFDTKYPTLSDGAPVPSLQ